MHILRLVKRVPYFIRHEATHQVHKIGSRHFYIVHRAQELRRRDLKHIMVRIDQ